MEERQLRTGIDRFLELVTSSKELRLSDASKKLGVQESTLELWADVLNQDKLVEIGYDGFGKMIVRAIADKAPAVMVRDAGQQKKSPAKAESVAESPVKKSGELKGPAVSAVIKGILKKNRGLPLLKRYSKVRLKDKQESRSEEGIVSKVINVLKKPFGRKKAVFASDNDFDDLRRKLDELKKMK